MFTAKFDKKLIPGTWHAGRWGVMFKCPKGHIGSLADHKIGSDGAVTPSVVCPHEGCDFHEMVQLKGWAEYSA